MSVMTVLSVNMVTANILLSVFCLSGALANCPQPTHLFITAPKTMDALSGSCLQIPCNFSAPRRESDNFDSSRQIFGVWIKNNSKVENNRKNVIFNGSGTNNIYPVNITGDLSQLNCTTLFSTLNTTYTNTYFFRVENLPFKATAVCDTIQITVKDSPPSPTIQISGDQRERESVTITCSAFTPCPHSPPKLTWSLKPDPHNKIEEGPDHTFTTKIQQKMVLSDQHDGYNITCYANYSVNKGNDFKTAVETKTLSVSYAPKNTSVTISPSGMWLNLTCSSRAKPPVSRFTWFKRSKDGDMNVSEGDFYTVNVTTVTAGVYYCVATNDVGNETSREVDLTDKDVSFRKIGAVLGGIFGIILFICLIVCVWCLKSAHQTHQTQGQTEEELAAEEPARNTEEENIHYGEINFSERRQKPSSESVRDSGQQQETLYAPIKVSQPTNSSTQTADSPDDLYSQVKKK